MFCKNCGQAIEEGRAFCKNCGTPVGQSTGTAPDTPGFLPGGRPAAPGGYGAGWQPPLGPPPGRNRTGLIIGSVAAAVIVLAGLGIGLWLGLRGDDAGATDSTKVAASTTLSGPGTSGTGTTGSETTSSSDGAATTQTIPGLTTSTGGPGPTGTTDPVDVFVEWDIARENLVMEMDYEDGRIPELADEINSTAPNVPAWVRAELVDMAEILGTYRDNMAPLPVPPGYEDAHDWLTEAAGHMAGRIQATIDGIDVMAYTGTVGAATDAFNTGRAERDAYRAAMDEFYAALPPD